jgi:Fe-S-cluster containining protein
MSDEGERWYSAGLRFSCTGCGRCCSGTGSYVWVSREEICRLAERFGLGLDAFGRRFVRRVGTRYALVDGAHGDCVFLVGRSCSVYEDRPSQCRAFPWWPVNLASPEAWERAALACEGIRDDAPVVARDVIDRCVDVARAAGLVDDAGPGDPEKPAR